MLNIKYATLHRLLMESIDPKYEQDVSVVTKNVITHAFRLSLVGQQKEKDQQIIVDKILLSQFLTTTMLLHLMHTIPLTCSYIQV